MTERDSSSHEPQEELVPADDRIIGRVFVWSLAVIFLLGSIVGLAAYLARTDETPEKTRQVDVETPQKLIPKDESMPAVRFLDITRESGIDFLHVNGSRGEKLLPETMGSGAAFFDYDNDGDQDLLLTNSREWPGASVTPPSYPLLYENDGSGHFRNVTDKSGLQKSSYGMGVAVGDYDNDGWVDVYLTAVGANHLFHNEQGRFEEVTDEAGVAGDAAEWSSSAGFLDYDNDGDLDLFVCNYVRWSRQIDLQVNFTLNGKDRAYGPPTNFTGTYPTLFRNEGDGRFSDVSAESGIQINNPVTGDPMAKALAVSPVDIDRDGFIDLVVANDTVQNFLFHNRGDGTFEELGAFAGVGFDSHGKATGAMGADSAYYRNDPALAVAIGNFANEMTSFLVSQDDPLVFSDQAAGEGIGSPSRLNLTFGLFFFDYDLDGRLDFLQVNGHLEEAISLTQASQHYRQPAQLFWNTGAADRSAFVEVPSQAAGDLSRPLVGRGAAYADIDGDGDLDVVLTQTAGSPMLLRNEQTLGHHWLRVKLRGSGSNRDGIGSWIEVKAGGQIQRRQVMPTRSYLSQVELPVTFGLGETREVEFLAIRWAGGGVQNVSGVEIDRLLTVEQAR